MDATIRERLLKAIRYATDKKPRLDMESMREIKDCCKLGSHYVQVAFEALMSQLEANHPLVRHRAVDIIADLFQRSKVFRGLLLSQFTTFLELAVGGKVSRPLPQPAAAAQALHLRSVELLKEWAASFGSVYPQLLSGQRYISSCGASMRSAFFPELLQRQQQEEADRLARHARSQLLLRDKFGRIVRDFGRLQASLQGVLRQLEQCRALMAPSTSSAAASVRHVTATTTQQALQGALPAATQAMQALPHLLGIPIDGISIAPSACLAPPITPTSQRSAAAPSNNTAAHHSTASPHPHRQHLQDSRAPHTAPAPFSPPVLDAETPAAHSLADQSGAEEEDVEWEEVDMDRVVVAARCERDAAAGESGVGPAAAGSLDSNGALIQAVSDLCKLVTTRYSPKLTAWQRVIVALDDVSGGSSSTCTSTTRDAPTGRPAASLHAGPSVSATSVWAATADAGLRSLAFALPGAGGRVGCVQPRSDRSRLLVETVALRGEVQVLLDWARAVGAYSAPTPPPHTAASAQPVLPHAAAHTALPPSSPPHFQHLTGTTMFTTTTASAHLPPATGGAQSVSATHPHARQSLPAASTAAMQQPTVHATHRHTSAAGSGAVAPRGPPHPGPSFRDQPLQWSQLGTGAPHQPPRPGGGTGRARRGAAQPAGRRLSPGATAVPSQRRAGVSEAVQGTSGAVESGGLARDRCSETTRDAEQERRLALLFGGDDGEGGGGGEGASSGGCSDLEEGLPEATAVSRRALVHVSGCTVRAVSAHDPSKRRLTSMAHPQLAGPSAMRGQPPHAQQHNRPPQPTGHESAKRRLKAAATAAAAAVAAAERAGGGGGSGSASRKRGARPQAGEDLAHNDMALVAGDDVTLAQHLQDAERKRQEVETALVTAQVVMKAAAQASARVTAKPKMGRGGIALAKKLHRR
ncbi:MAG: hypothetical protein WDW38_006820 [Sanguina aurantia]